MEESKPKKERTLIDVVNQESYEIQEFKRHMYRVMAHEFKLPIKIKFGNHWFEIRLTDE